METRCNVSLAATQPIAAPVVSENFIFETFGIYETAQRTPILPRYLGTRRDATAE